ncbi:MAG TPA: polysaccharide biosynthesis protein, partial [Planctomycetota bacterium]|nr:polysaccharide biosynthesis protein [Planctomycetota bacterium]
SLDPRGPCRFVSVRFGNVLSSAGSVIPLFREQIGRGGPVTVTHPDMERFFMTIPEACRLVLEAAGRGAGGDVMVLDMGEPIKIVTLAEQMIRLSGFEPRVDIEIVFTGVRPGEKLSEELVHDGESLEPTGVDKLYRWRGRSGTVSVVGAVDALGSAPDDAARVKALLATILPEYRPLGPETPALRPELVVSPLPWAPSRGRGAAREPQVTAPLRSGSAPGDAAAQAGSG